VRSGSTKQQLTGAALSAFLLRKLGRHWDGAPVPNVGAAELDPDAFRRFRAQAARSGRLGDESLLGNDLELLDRLHLTEGRLLKRAALILFHAEPERFVSGASVKIGFFDSGAEVLYHDVIEGSLFRQVASTLDLLTTKYLRARISYEGVQRVETLPVPEPALRESLINALIHRDYSVPAPVQIRVYADRVSIWNPGHLPPSWTPDTLRQRHPSAPPNPDIANAFFRAGMIEAWGQGIEKVLAACRGRGLPEPLMHFDGVGLAVEFRFAAPVTDPVTDPVTGPVTGPVIDPVTGPVTDPVLRLLLSLGSEALAPSVLQQRLGLKHRPTFRDNYLRPALAAGLIEMTVPERPQSRLQKYRLTAPGRARLSASRKP